MTLPGPGPTDADVAAVTALIGREPRGEFRVVVRSPDGEPIVVMNAPLLADGTPMPTLYWLVGRKEVAAVSTIEADSVIDQVEAMIGLERIDEIHQSYAAERERLMPPDHEGPRPSGGVGGTRRGVKCLHAHLAYWLAGGPDPIGEWVAARIDARSTERVDRP